MANPFTNLKQHPEIAAASDPEVHKLSDEARKKKRDAMYAEYTPMINGVLDQLIEAYRPGAWKKGSDCDHEFCCHCRWYAGPEETGRAHYGDHAVRRRLEIELEIDYQCDPTGFKVVYYDNHGKCVHTALSQEALVRGVQSVFE